MNEATSILEDLTIEEGSLVDKGDNPEAHIQLFKMKEEEKKEEPQEMGFFAKLRQWVGLEKGEYLEEARTMDEILTERDYLKEFHKLRDAFSESVGSILDHSHGEEMAQKLQETVEQFTNSARDLAGQMTKGNQEAEKRLFGILSDLQNSVDGDDAISRKGFAKAAIELGSFQIDEQEADLPMEGKETEKMENQESPAVVLPTEDQPQEAAKTADIQKQMDAMKGELEAARQTITKMEEERSAAQYLAKARDLKTPGVDVNDLAVILQKADSQDPEFGSKVLEVIKGLTTQIQTSENLLFKSMGSVGTSDPNSPAARLESIAKEIQTAEKMSFAKAYDEAMSRNPQLASDAIQG